MNTATIIATGVEVTVVEVKKGGWTVIQLSDGTLKKVRSNTLTFDEVNAMDTINNTGDIMEEAMVMSFQDQLAAIAADLNDDSDIDALISNAIASIREEEGEKESREYRNTLDMALGFINAIKIAKDLRIAGKTERVQLLRGIVNYAKWWSGLHTVKVQTPVTRTGNYYVTKEQYILDTLTHFVNNNQGLESLVEEFTWGVENILRKYRTMTDEQIENRRGIDKDMVKARIYLQEIEAPIQVVVTRYAVLLTAVAGESIMSNQGIVTTFKTTSSVGLTAMDVKSKLVQLMNNVHIHKEVRIIDTNGREAIRYNENEVVIEGSLFNKVFLIKHNKISLDRLNVDSNKHLVLANVNNGLHTIEFPALPTKLGNVYAQTSGLVDPTEARNGIITVGLSNINNLVEFVNDTAFTLENINKAVSRLKLEKQTWSAGTQRIFVVYDATTEELNNLLGTGSIYVPKSFLERYMLCRVTTKMGNGGIKSVTNYLPGNEKFIVGPAAFKGGFNGMVSALGVSIAPSRYVDLDHKSVKAIKTLIESKLEKEFINGVAVKGLWIEVELNISNAIGVEDFKRSDEAYSEIAASFDASLKRASALVDSAVEKNGLRDQLMDRSVSEEGFSMVNAICEGLSNGTIVRKPNTTRHAVSLFQTAVQWYGKSTVMGLIDSIVDRMSSNMGSKKLAAQFLTDEMDTKGSMVSVKAVAEKMISICQEERRVIDRNISTYPIALRDYLLEEFEVVFSANEQRAEVEWSTVTFNGTKVNVPSNDFFYNKEQGNENEYTFLANGFMKDFLDAVKTIITVEYDKENNTVESYNINMNSMSGAATRLEAIIQSRILGKAFGYLKTIGGYQVMLPSSFNDQQDYEVFVTDVSRFIADNDDMNQWNADGSLALNGVKYPAYFRQAFAGYNMSEVSFGDDVVDFALQKAVFMTHHSIMIMQNDCDGDAHCFSNDGYQLPLFEGPANDFNGISFTSFVEDEQDGNKIKMKATQESSMVQVQQAIYQAGNAQSNIGLFTSTKYVYEVVLEQVSSFIGTDGNIYELDTVTRNQILSTLAYLCQVEAMDNVKQEGEKSKSIMDGIAYGKLRSIKGTDTKSVEQVRSEIAKSLIASVKNFLVKANWNVNIDEFATIMVQSLVYASSLTSDLLAHTIFQDRAVKEKRFDSILALELGESVRETYNFKGRFDNVSSSIDSESMYAYVAKVLVGKYNH